jgi:hypothetical protein
MKMKKLIIRTTIILLSVVITLFLLEVGVRSFYKFRFKPKGTAPIPAPKTYRVSKNKNLVFELIPGSKAYVKGIPYKINAWGFRDKKYRERKAHEKRIIFVGDSLTYGWLIPLAETYHKQLETLMTEKGYSIDIFGMGVVGYNIIQEFHIIKENIPRFNPDMVILQICPNDFERRLSIRKKPDEKSFVLTPYYDFSIPYVFKKTKTTEFLMKHSHLFRFINLKMSWLEKKDNEDYTPKHVFLLGEEKAFSYLTKIKKYLDSKDIPFSVVIFPFKKVGENYIYTSIHQKIHDHLDNMEVPYLDLYEEFNLNNKNTGMWIDRLHLNKRGYDIAADRLYDFLIPQLYENIK